VAYMKSMERRRVAMTKIPSRSMLTMVALGVSLMFQPSRGQEVAMAQQIVGRGDWQSLGGETIHGTWKVMLQRSGAHVDGTMELTGSNMLSTGSASGTIDGQNVVLGVSWNGVAAASFSGQLTGDSISGEWDCAAVKDQGVWHGTLSLGK